MTDEDFMRIAKYIDKQIHRQKGHVLAILEKIAECLEIDAEGTAFSGERR